MCARADFTQLMILEYEKHQSANIEPDGKMSCMIIVNRWMTVN